jgi:hypothetical protein
MGVYWDVCLIVSREDFVKNLEQFDIQKVSGRIARIGSYKKSENIFLKTISSVAEIKDFLEFYDRKKLEKQVKFWILTLEIKFMDYQYTLENSYSLEFSSPMNYLVLCVSPPWDNNWKRRYLVSDSLRLEFMNFLAGFRPLFGFTQVDCSDSSIKQIFGFRDEIEEVNQAAIYRFFKNGYNRTFFLPEQNFPFELLSYGVITVVQGTKFVLSLTGFGNEVLLETGLEIPQGQSSLEFEPDDDFKYRENQTHYDYHDEIKAAFELMEETTYATIEPPKE